MAAIRYTLAVELEDGTEWEVTGDQRDLSAWEIFDGWRPAAKQMAVRYMAWNASSRQNLTKLSWNKFHEVCVQVSDVDAGEVKELDPTQRDQPDES
jgi:hypothetical protein